MACNIILHDLSRSASFEKPSESVVDLDMLPLCMHTVHPSPLLDISYNDCQFPVEDNVASSAPGVGSVSRTRLAIETDHNLHHDHQNYEQPPQQAYGSIAITDASVCIMPSITNRPELKRPKSAIENAEGTKLSDVGDAVEGEMGDGKATSSRNFVCQRRVRRKKLNKKPFSLASIGARRIKELQTQVEGEQSEFPTYRISELNVSDLDENLFHFDFRCEKGTGLMVQLTRALEALNLDIINANLSSVGDQVINTIVIKVDEDEMLKPKEIEDRIVEVADKFGFSHLECGKSP